MKNFEKVSEVHTVKKAPPLTTAMFFDGSKFREQCFEKGHTTNNLVKLFQIFTSGFGEEDF